MTSCTIELNRTRDDLWFGRAWWTEWEGDRPRRRHADTEPDADAIVAVTGAARLASEGVRRV